MKQNRRMARFFALVLSLALLAGLLPESVRAAAEWSVKSNTEIFWVETADSQLSDADLKAQVQLFSQELKAKGLTTSTLAISYGEQSLAGVNDIVLILDSSLGMAKQGYKITVSGGQLHVSASDADGLFYGCRFVMQALLGGISFSGVAGKVIKPDYEERAFFLDCGRKYYSPAWIKDMIREMSWSNMNAIYIHFSEEMGFRLESKTYPWLAGGDNTLCTGGAAYGVAADNGKYITQDEMREIAKVAKLYHVEIIPSLDSPGHMNYAVKKYNAKYGTDIGNYFHYNGQKSIVKGSGPETAQTSYSRGIDISNADARTFAQNLYKEYAAFFKELGCTKFDIGGDELLGWGSAVVSTSTASRWKQLDHWKTYAQNRSGNSKAVAYDAFMYYMNDIYDIVKSYGYTSIRMWNDDALRDNDTGWQKVVTLRSGMEIQYWTPSANGSKNTVTTYLNAGYKVYNFLNSYTYYVLGQVHDGSSGYTGITPQRIYENWAPNIFKAYGSTAGTNTAIGASGVKGSAFCVWCDKPSAETAAQVKAGVLPSLRMNAAKSWDANMNASRTYASVQQLVTKLGNAPTNLPAAPKVTHKVPAPVINFTALDAALAAFDGTVAANYTVETYGAYRAHAADARVVRNKANVTQEEVDEAAALLNAARASLRAASAVATEEDDWFLSIAARSKKANQGKLFTLTIYVRIDADVTGYEVYDETGKRVEPRDVIFANTAYLKYQKDGVTIRINADVKGVHTYTVYAINSAGQRSPDSRSITVTVV